MTEPQHRKELTDAEAVAAALGLTAFTYADLSRRRYWRIACGTRGQDWLDWVRHGVVTVGGGRRTRNLGGCTSADEIMKRLGKNEAGSGRRRTALSLWRFRTEMRPGDVVYASNGRGIHGRGVVTSGCLYSRKTGIGEDHWNLRRVTWTHWSPFTAYEWSEWKLSGTLVDHAVRHCDEVMRLEQHYLAMPHDPPPDGRLEPLPARLYSAPGR
ncbi:hypothetical protein [Sutterella sp.]|uniref:hypothetical protein n=1 Tax=Sutterella sp. TaxID=1981025 RepID=UPI0026DF0EF7|nr:hypothetical protein [Sutterella sp.]MDO5532535.1 hypothetical protein [Sutterella sp.]